MSEKKNISDYLKEHDIQWATPMPSGCPPVDILVPNEHPFFRFAAYKDCYTAQDFMTYRDFNPEKDWGNMLPLAVGLSLIDDESKARKSLKLPYLKKFKGIISLSLNPMDGVVKQTGVHLSHYTWWRTTSFDMSNLKMLEL